MWVECAVVDRCRPMWVTIVKHRFALRLKGPAEVYARAMLTL